MKQFDGDITAVTAGIICHIATNTGLMIERVSQRIRRKWPVVKSEYTSMYIDHDLDLGEVVFTNAERNDFNLQVATMVCENGWATQVNGHVDSRLDYQALRRCVRKVAIWQKTCVDGRLPVYVPHGIGCGDMNGDWRIVKAIIKNEIPKAIVIRENKL